MSFTALKSIAFAAVLGTTPVSAALILTTGAGAPTPPDSSSAATSSDEWTPAAIENLKGLPQSASSAALLTLPADEGPQLFSRGPVIAHTAPTAAVHSSHPAASSTPGSYPEAGIDPSPLAAPGGIHYAAGPVSFLNMTSYRTLLVLMPTAGDVAVVDSLQPLSIHPPASDGAPPPNGSTAAVTVPEPSTAILSLAAALTSLLQRRRR
jgi:hypothetical protein